MNRWRAEYDDGIWRFYRDGMELGLYEKGDVVVDALNVAESHIAELEAEVTKGHELQDSYCDRIAELDEQVAALQKYADGAMNENDDLEFRIAELEAERKKAFDLVRKLRMYCIYANWDNPDTEDEFNEFDAEVCEYLSEYKVCVDQLTAHDATERQDDKSPNDTQTQTIVYGKECEE